MNILDKTRELGELIQECDEMKAFKAAELAQAQDDTAQVLMQEYNVKRMNLARDMQSGKITREEAISQNTKAFDEVLEKSETIRNYIETKKAFDDLVGQINRIINYYITGQDPDCTHDCSTCGGCH